MSSKNTHKNKGDLIIDGSLHPFVPSSLLLHIPTSTSTFIMAIVKTLLVAVGTIAAVVVAFLFGALHHNQPHHRLIITTLSPLLPHLEPLFTAFNVNLQRNPTIKLEEKFRVHKLPDAQHLSAYFDKQPPTYLDQRDSQELEYEYCEAVFPSKENWKRPENHNLKLQRTVTIFRHGDRTPVRKFPFAEHGVQYQCDKGIWPKHIIDHQHFSKEGLTWNGTCNVGQLTSRGTRQLSSLGKRFREVYFSNSADLGMWWLNDEKKRVDPNDMETYEQSIDDAIYIRSTDVPRTIESAHHFYTGLLPILVHNHFKTPNMFHRFVIYPLTIDSLTDPPSYMCPSLHKLVASHPGKDHAEDSKNEIIHKLVDSLVTKSSIKDEAAWEWIKELKADYFFDAVNVRRCHGQRSADHGMCFVVNNQQETEQKHCISQADSKKLVQIALEEHHHHHFGVADRDWGLKLSRVRTGFLVGEILDMLVNGTAAPLKSATPSATNDNSGSNAKKRAFFLSAHDSSISAMLGVLVRASPQLDTNVFLSWPPYASSLTFELWKDENANINNNDDDNEWVRIVYNGKVLDFDWFYLDGKPKVDGMCRMSTFLKALEKFIIHESLQDICFS